MSPLVSKVLQTVTSMIQELFPTYAADPARRRRPPRRARSRAAAGRRGAPGPRPGARGCGHRQDPGDHPPDGVRRRDGRLRARPRSWRSRSRRARRARCAGGCASSALPVCRPARSTRRRCDSCSYFWPRTHGTELPTLTESKIGMVAGAARRLRVDSDQALLRDVASEIEWAKVSNVRPRRLRERRARSWPVGQQPRPRDGRAPLRDLRAGQARPGPDGLRGRPPADRRPARPGPAGRRAGAVAVQVVRRRRVPGRLAAPVRAARAVARRPPGALRGRRPGADDLLLRRRQRALPP